MEKTINQTESQQVKSNASFWQEGKTVVPGETGIPRENRSSQGKTSQKRVDNQQTQSTYDGGSGNRTQAI